MGGEVELVLFNNKSIAAWVEARYSLVIIKTNCFQSKIFQSWWNLYLATPNPRARMIGHIANVLTYGHAALEKGSLFWKPLRYAPNGHELVFGVGNCESGDSQKNRYACR
jgi:hypothetical protein